MNQKNQWEKQYSGVDNLWDMKPKDTLVNYTPMIPMDGKVLDLGMGEG